jgi:hypothetical protein
MLVFTHSDVGNGQKIDKLKLKIGAGYRHAHCAVVATFVIITVLLPSFGELRNCCVLPCFR